ncbi:energy transducer TonB family protein [Helicobacter sp. T3_23-1056]
MPKHKAILGNFIGFLLSSSAHIGLFALFFLNEARQTRLIESGTDAPLAQNNTSMTMLYTLPIGRFQEVSINATKSIESNDTQKQKSDKNFLTTTYPKNHKEMPNNDKNSKENTHNDSQASAQSILSQDLTNSTQKDSYASTPKEAQNDTVTTTAMGASSNDKISYQGLLAAHINRFKQYPSLAFARGQEGIIVVSIQVDENGFVLTKAIKQKCAFDSLNSEVLALIDRANPLPKPPKEMLKGNKLTFSLPLAYSLKDYKK